MFLGKCHDQLGIFYGIAKGEKVLVVTSRQSKREMFQLKRNLFIVGAEI
jgi:hypothetical protein